MLTGLIDLCLRYRPIVLLATVILAVFGAASLLKLPFDAFPDTTPVQVQVNTTAPALSPLEVERQITFSVEQAISGLPGLTEVRSMSKFGFSQVTAIFDDDTDIYLARQVVSERLAAAELPEGVGRPALGPVATGLGEVFQYLVTERHALSARAPHAPSLGHPAPDGPGARRRGDQHVGRLREAVPRPRGPQKPRQARPHPGRRRRRSAPGQPQRGRRRARRGGRGPAHPGAGAGGERGRPASDGARERGWDADPPAGRRGRARGDEIRRGAVTPKDRARPCSVWASCSWARTAARSPGGSNSGSKRCGRACPTTSR
jgi:hypothetical protein